MKPKDPPPWPFRASTSPKPLESIPLMPSTSIPYHPYLRTGSQALEPLAYNYGLLPQLRPIPDAWKSMAPQNPGSLPCVSTEVVWRNPWVALRPSNPRPAPRKPEPPGGGGGGRWWLRIIAMTDLGREFRGGCRGGMLGDGEKQRPLRRGEDRGDGVGLVHYSKGNGGYSIE